MTEAEQARADERAKVVAYLRGVADKVEREAPARGLEEYVEVGVFALRVSADKIERGDHHKEQGQ